MTRRMSNVCVVLTLFVALAAASYPPTAHAQVPLGTSFAYQGRLTDGGSPATGTYDILLTAFDAAAAGSQVGPIVTRDEVVVANGLFTVAVDFGPVFAGSKRWLQIGVRPGSSTGAYVVLAPRQELTPSPNAVFSASAPWTGVAGKPVGFADDTDNDALGGLSCANGQVAKWNGTAWGCAGDANSGGTVTAVTGGTGLTGGTITTSGTLAVNSAVVQSRVIGSCPPGQSIRLVNADGTVACQPDTTGADWGLTGNAGTNPAAHFIGTSDGQPLEFRVNGGRALRLEPTISAPNVVGGFLENAVTPGAYGAAIAGGGASLGGSNAVTDNFGTVGGGRANLAGDAAGPTNSAIGATVSGGNANTASGTRSTVSGGESNRASGGYSTVLGGIGNVAGGEASLAAGAFAQVRTPAEVGGGDLGGDEGTFLWSDAQGTAFQSTGPNQFLVRAAGGVGINTNAPSPGGLTVASPGKLTFGATARQMIDLWGPGKYGIGVQSQTTYFRTDFGFAWFQNGSHSDVLNDPGPGGNRLMRLHESGNLFVQGTLNPGGADFAEMLPAEDGLEPGDVLAIGPDGQLALSTTPYQESLAGVYSTKPGLVGGAADGESTAGRVPLAVAGVVPVKVTDEGGPIVPGDSLTSSSTPGHAMKAARVRVGGMAFLPSGVVIGKALEPLPRGQGVIRALVVLQ